MKNYNKIKIKLIGFLFVISLLLYIFKSFALENLENLKNNFEKFFIEYQNQAKDDLNVANKYLYDYVNIAIKLNKQQEASSFLRNFLDSYNPFFLKNLADSLFILNDFNNSKKAYLNLINLLYNPNINSISDNSKNIISYAYFKLSNIEYINGNITNYFKYLKDSIYFDRDYYSVLKKKIIFLKDSFIFNQNNYDLNDFDKIEQIISNEIYDKNKIYDSKNQKIEFSDEILLYLTDLYYNLYLFSFNDFYKSKALDYLNKIKNKNNTEYYYLLINLEDNEDKKIEIIKQLVLKFKDVDPSFYEQLGDYYYKNQDLNNALDYYLKLVNIIPTKKTVLFKIANIYYNKNDFLNALNYINLAIKLDDNPDYYYFKGEILLALNELTQALESFKLAYDKYNDISLKAKALTKIKNTQDLINKINKNKN